MTVSYFVFKAAFFFCDAKVVFFSEPAKYSGKKLTKKSALTFFFVAVWSFFPNFIGRKAEENAGKG